MHDTLINLGIYHIFSIIENKNFVVTEELSNDLKKNLYLSLTRLDKCIVLIFIIIFRNTLLFLLHLLYTKVTSLIKGNCYSF